MPDGELLLAHLLLDSQASEISLRSFMRLHLLRRHDVNEKLSRSSMRLMACRKCSSAPIQAEPLQGDDRLPPSLKKENP